MGIRNSTGISVSGCVTTSGTTGITLQWLNLPIIGKIHISLVVILSDIVYSYSTVLSIMTLLKELSIDLHDHLSICIIWAQPSFSVGFSLLFILLLKCNRKNDPL